MLFIVLHLSAYQPIQSQSKYLEKALESNQNTIIVVSPSPKGQS